MLRDDVGTSMFTKRLGWRNQPHRDNMSLANLGGKGILAAKFIPNGRASCLKNGLQGTS